MKGVGAIFVMYAPLFTLFTLLQITYGAPKKYYKVFVYDDFKRGETCHNYLVDEINGISRFIQEGHIVQKYPLVVSHGIAFLLDYPGKGHNVNGEVFDFDSNMLESMDVVQEHPTFYFRRLESIQLKNSTANEKPIQCWTYFYNETEPELLELPLLSEFHSNDDDFYSDEITTTEKKFRTNESTTRKVKFHKV